MKPLVSILIPAYNSESWIADTLRSALSQTWSNKEIIVVDDGSTDRTADVANQFASKGVKVVTIKNGGAAAARNHALHISKGDYIQWLDADDLLSPVKIERQMLLSEKSDRKRVLLSAPWGYFNYRISSAHFTRTALWEDLSPGEWLWRKMSMNLHMQTATWLTSRELADAAGLWDTRLLSDDDGEYFCRVLLASEGTRFAEGANVYYRITHSSRLSHIGVSDRKKDALLVSMKLHLQYIQSLEESDRVRQACLIYMQTWYENFYPERPDLVVQLQELAAELDGQLKEPTLRWKFMWLKPILGWTTAKWAQREIPQLKAFALRQYDKLLYKLETRDPMCTG